MTDEKPLPQPAPDQAPDQTDESSRRHVELGVLLAAIGIPGLLWLTRMGIATQIAEGLADQFFKHGSSLSMLYLLLTTLVLLLIWRDPFWQRSNWMWFVLLIFTEAMIPAWSVLVWYRQRTEFARFDWQHYGGYWAGHIVVSLGAIGLFVIVRRLTGIRLISGEDASLPRRPRLSIRELLIVIFLMAILFLVTPFLVRGSQIYQAGGSATYVIINYLFNIAALAGPVLIVVMVSHLKPVPRILIATLAIFFLQVAQDITFAWWYSYSMQASWMTEAIRTLFTMLPVMLGLWILQQRGYRFVSCK